MTGRPPRVALLLRGGSYAYQDEIIGGAHQECSARGVDLYCLSGGNVTTADPRNFIYALPGAGDLEAAVIVKGTMGAARRRPGHRARCSSACARCRSASSARRGRVFACVAVDNSSGVRA